MSVAGAGAGAMQLQLQWQLQSYLKLQSRQQRGSHVLHVDASYPTYA